MGFAEQVHDVLDEQGWGLTTLDATHACIGAGVISESEVRNAGIRAFQNRVRDAMATKDGNGLPRAGQTARKDPASGAPIWDRRETWGQADYQLNFDLHMEQGAAHLRVADKLRDEYRQRFRTELAVRAEWRRLFFS